MSIIMIHNMNSVMLFLFRDIFLNFDYIVKAVYTFQFIDIIYSCINSIPDKICFTAFIINIFIHTIKHILFNNKNFYYLDLKLLVSLTPFYFCRKF